MPTIVHIIGGLNVGGAERMLQRLVMEHSKQRDVTNVVISLTDLGIIGDELRAQKVRVETLGINRFVSFLLALPRIVFLLKSIKPDIVQTWLYSADFLGGIAAKIAGVRTIVWNIRCTIHGGSAWTNTLMKLNGFLSSTVPDSIIFCGYEAMRFHQRLGYSSSQMEMIPNGYDLNYFNAAVLRKNNPAILETKKGDSINLVAIGRNDKLKDYANLLDAMSVLSLIFPRLQLFIYGRNCASDPQLTHKIDVLNLSKFVKLQDQIPDVRIPLLSADIFVSSSMSEGFPNVIAEAMAMSVPCVATDAGDAAVIVGDTGQIVPVRDAESLARAIVKLATLEDKDRSTLGLRARDRIARNFEIGFVAQQYFAHYQKLMRLSGQHFT